MSFRRGAAASALGVTSGEDKQGCVMLGQNSITTSCLTMKWPFETLDDRDTTSKQE